MMKRLEGRNLKHPGCLIGVTTGLIVGIVLAGVLAYANVPYNVLILIWLGLTVVLGAIGWIIGNSLTSRVPVVESTEEEGKIDESASSEA
jgi:hypothetical protein